MDLITIITEHEDKKKSAYQDSLGYWTIGIGRLIDARKNAGLSEDEMIYLLKNDINDAASQLKHYSWFNDLDEIRQGVLIELCFNIGMAGVLEFKEMIHCLSLKHYTLAADSLLDSKWSVEVGKNRSQNMAHRLETGCFT